MKGRITFDGHTFKSEGELKRYLGLRELVKTERIANLEVNLGIPLLVNQQIVTEYSPTFRFYDRLSHQERWVQVLSRSANPALDLKIRLFEALFTQKIERWGDG